MTTSLFAGLTAAPADPILGVSEKFRADPRAEKVNLGVGAYLTEEGKTPILEVVQEAEEAIVAARIPHTYIPISGLAGTVNSCRRWFSAPPAKSFFPDAPQRCRPWAAPGL